MVRLLLSAALALLLGCGPQAPEPEPEPVEETTAPAPAIAREQLFFSGRSDDGPVLATLVLQREPRRTGALIEAKGFVSMAGAWRAPFFQRVELRDWPGVEVSSALEAWRGAPGGAALRIEWEDDGDALTASARSRGASVQLSFAGLAAAGGEVGPHGPLSWRAGRATLSLDGAEVSGVGVVESLRGEIAEPRFGRFEMWLLAPTAGSLVLGRRTLDSRAAGFALRVDSVGRAELGEFDVTVVSGRTHEATGFELPTSWRLPLDGDLVVSRGEGQGSATVGVSAVYDIGPASSADGRSQGLVFHLQDQPAP